MPTAGATVIRSSGKRGVLSDGKLALFNASGLCSPCCAGGATCIVTGSEYRNYPGYEPSEPVITDEYHGWQNIVVDNVARTLSAQFRWDASTLCGGPQVYRSNLSSGTFDIRAYLYFTISCTGCYVTQIAGDVGGNVWYGAPVRHYVYAVYTIASISAGTPGCSTVYAYNSGSHAYNVASVSGYFRANADNWSYGSQGRYVPDTTISFFLTWQP
jgi:hypothetical protein